MRDVEISAELQEEMATHALESYPDECCGFLIGDASDASGSARSVRAVQRAANVFDGERRRRFLIHPQELREMERKMEQEGRAVVGFYHSHPDHPARPSQYDQDHAWPWYSYLVLSVGRDGVTAVGAFELDEETSTFREVSLFVRATADAHDSIVVG